MTGQRRIEVDGHDALVPADPPELTSELAVALVNAALRLAALERQASSHARTGKPDDDALAS